MKDMHDQAPSIVAIILDKNTPVVPVHNLRKPD